MIFLNGMKIQNILNYKKHGINFEAASLIFESDVIEIQSKNSQTEIRIMATGVQDSKRYITVIYTERETKKAHHISTEG